MEGWDGTADGKPTELTIRGLESTAVKEFSSQEEGQRRRWTVQLAERQIGRVRLAIDFTQPGFGGSENARRTHSLPLIQAEDVEYQSGLVAVEGDAELDVKLMTDAATREVDIGGFFDELDQVHALDQATVLPPERHTATSAAANRRSMRSS